MSTEGLRIDDGKVFTKMTGSTGIQLKVIVLLFGCVWSPWFLLAQVQQQRPPGVDASEAKSQSPKETSQATSGNADDEKDVLSAEYTASLRNAIYQVRKFCRIAKESTRSTDAYKLAFAEARAATDAALGMADGQLALNADLIMGVQMPLVMGNSELFLQQEQERLSRLGGLSGTPSDPSGTWDQLEKKVAIIERSLNAIITGEVPLRKYREVPVFPGASRLTEEQTQPFAKVSYYQTKGASADVAGFYRQSLKGFLEKQAKCGIAVCLSFTRDLGGSTTQFVNIQEVGEGTKIWIGKAGAGNVAKGAGSNQKP